MWTSNNHVGRTRAMWDATSAVRQPGRLPSTCRQVYFPYSFFTTSPPFITNFTCSRVVTSFNGIAVHGNDVGPCSRLDRAHFARPAEQIRGIDRRSLNRLQGTSSPSFTITANSCAFMPVRINGRIRAERDFHSAGKRMRDVLAGRRHHSCAFASSGGRQPRQSALSIIQSPRYSVGTR